MSNCGCNNSNNYGFLNNYANNDYNNFRNNMNNNPFPNNYLYGHAYTPNQTLNKTFTPEDSLRNGTLFPELVSPYMPGDSIGFINYLRNGGR